MLIPTVMHLCVICTQFDNIFDDDDDTMIRDFHRIDDLKLTSKEPPPLVIIAGSRLHSAVFNGELIKIRLLVEVFHCSPLAVNRNGHTTLHTAATCGELAVLKYFIEDRLVNPAIESIGQETPLHCAAENGHLSIVQYLVETQLVDPLIVDRILLTPLHCACMSGSVSTVQYLIHESQQYQPYSPNEVTSTGKSLLHYAAESGNPEVIRHLQTTSFNGKNLIKEEDVNSKDKVRKAVLKHSELQ